MTEPTTIMIHSQTRSRERRRVQVYVLDWREWFNVFCKLCQ